MASADVDRELETLIRARYPIIYIVSWEEKRVEDALRNIAQARGKKIFFWTITQGMVANPNHRDNAGLRELIRRRELEDEVMEVFRVRNWINFVRVYQPLADLWSVYDNSGETPRLLERNR